MKIALIGATGRVGGWVLENCLEKNYSVRVLCRNVDKLADYSDRIEVVPGDATNSEDLKKLVTADVDVIISTIGSPSNAVLIVESTAKALVEALSEMAESKKKIPRIVWMTATGVNEATEQAMMYPLCGNKPNKWCCGYGCFGFLIFKCLIPFVIGQELWNDMGLSEDVIRNKPEINKRAVIVRPTNMHPVSEEPVFSDKWRQEGGTNTDYVFCQASDPPPGKWIWRRAISAALMDLVEDSSHDGTAVSLFQKKE